MIVKLRCFSVNYNDDTEDIAVELTDANFRILFTDKVGYIAGYG